MADEPESKNPETSPEETAAPESAQAEPKAEAKPESKPEKKSEAADKPDAEGGKAEVKAEAEPVADGEEAKPEKKEQTAADLLKEELGEVKIRRAKGSKNINSGICFVLATFNNTKVSFTDRQGNAISWSSAGKCNFRGSRKATAYAAQVVTQDAGRVAMSHGMKEVEVRVKGPGMGRDSAVRALQALGFQVSAIVDITPIPHNGCRPPKRRRV
jgi:small subunit ribosomal protein S11